MAKKVGILLVNLGTAKNPDAPSIRRFLREFLSDSRVVEIPRAIWLPLLYLVILPFRPRKLVPQYQAIWTDKGSPLTAITAEQAEALQQQWSDAVVRFGMRYGEPSIATSLSELAAEGCDHVVVLPMYPQYSSTTTATVLDAIGNWTSDQRVCPGITVVRDYCDHPAYIQALANSVSQSSANGHLVMSFHGIPQRNIDLGDIYEAQCHTTAKKLAQELGLNDSEYSVTFQSRLGRAQWLTPYTDDTLKEMAESGVQNVRVLCPGFPADCLETLEEIAVTSRANFIASGGDSLEYIPALNSQPLHIEALKQIISAHMP